MPVPRTPQQGRSRHPGLARLLETYLALVEGWVDVVPQLLNAQDGAENGPETPACKAEADYRDAFRAAVMKTMDEQKLDAFVYPTWSNPPRLIGDLNTPHGDNSQVFSPTTGWPAVQVPMGYTRGQLPAGLQLMGRAWSEAELIKMAYAYEQATPWHTRRPDLGWAR